MMIHPLKNKSPMFQMISLLPEALTGAEYLDFVSSMYECKTIQRRNQLIELFDMESALSRPIETYSHGMKKDTADCRLYA